ncbi:MAG: hypothetical protein GY809_09345 [Planctomycetes bacterium]|nr:hypothetical protein [Planctomycetota bacterium]
MKLSLYGLTVGLLLSTVNFAGAQTSSPAEYRVVTTLEIDRVPSWFPVGFSLLTRGQDQYAAYYNEKHHMIVAHRRIQDSQWQKVTLPSPVGWDSHNYITMAVDTGGNIHLSGNMHCVPLIYFRTTQPGDITTFKQQGMTGQEEQRCTYPRFLTTQDGTLLFMYRSGGSGNGRRFYNEYDVQAQTWSRLFDSPLFEGQGKRNAYPIGPVQGPTGLYHLVWVWRDTPDCATNHHLSHVATRDFRTWSTAGGQALELPITLSQTLACVDPIPSGGGIINGCERLVFDGKDRPIIAYHKRDEKGHMQIFVARFEEGHWHPRAVTTWDREVRFSGRGAMPFIGIRLGAVRTLPSDLVAIDYRHRDYGSGRILLDETFLRPVDREVVIPVEIPKMLLKPTLQFDGMQVKLAKDLGESPDLDRKYLLRWETLGAHHDRPRQPPLPQASVLNLVTLERLP